MSRRFRDKKLDLISLEPVAGSVVWDKSKKRKGKPTIRKDLEIYGRIDKGTSAFITKTNSTGGNFKFIEDTYKLPKNAKNKIVDMFNNQNKRVVYLVKKN